MKRKLKFNKKQKVIIRIVFYTCAAIAFIHIIHMLTLDRIVEYNEISFSSPNIPTELNGYKIAFITDTHSISESRLQSVVKWLNSCNLNLLLLGGDFTTNNIIMKKETMQKTIEELSRIKTTDGIYGVDGNHDNFIELFAEMEKHGIVPLPNSGLYIRDNYYLAGIRDFNSRAARIPVAIEGSQPEDFIILLSHNPDISMAQDTAGIDLILSGHTHGGQVAFFGIWAPYFTFTNHISRHGQRFKDGWAESRDGVPVFVSRGAGEYVPRIFARPQVIIITLESEK